MLDSNCTDAVFYCDAGLIMDSRPMYNRKNNLAGIGIHGYLYLNEEPKKGTGNPKAIPSDKGYVNKADLTDKTKKVTVTHYLDIVAGATGYASSNQAELRALIETLTWITTTGAQLTNVRIYSDSQYTVKGTNEWLKTWKKNGWKNSTGNDIKYRDMWLIVDNLLPKVQAQCTKGFKLEWLRGHDGHFGNEIADALATRGLAMAANHDMELNINFRDAQGYWKTDNQSPRILQAPRWYTSTTDHDYVDEKGRHIYYVGTHGTKDKEDELVGKRYSDNFLGVVKVSSPDPVMEEMRQKYLNKDPRGISDILITHLDVLFSPKQYKEIKDDGYRFTIDKDDRLEKVNHAGAILVTALEPMGLGFRMVEVWTNLAKYLDDIEKGKEDFLMTDLTETFFEKAPKKDEWKLKAEYSQIVKHIDVQAQFNLAKRNDPPVKQTKKIRLILGADILSRNQLAALAPEIESIHLVTWRESDEVGRYATFVRLTNGDIGLWSRYDSNYSLMPKA